MNTDTPDTCFDPAAVPHHPDLPPSQVLGGPAPMGRAFEFDNGQLTRVVEDDAPDVVPVSTGVLEHIRLQAEAEREDGGMHQVTPEIKALVATRLAARLGVKPEMDFVGEMVRQDDMYAWSWHANLACCGLDEGLDHEKSNRIAARFMQLLFGVDTLQHKHSLYKAPVEVTELNAPREATAPPVEDPAAMSLRSLNNFYVAADRGQFYRAFEQFCEQVKVALGIVVRPTKFPSVEDGSTTFPASFRFDVNAIDCTAMVVFGAAPKVDGDTVFVEVTHDLRGPRNCE